MADVYAGLDVSDQMTHICVVGSLGESVWTGVCASDPEVLAGTLRRHAPGLTHKASKPVGDIWTSTQPTPDRDHERTGT